VAITIPILTDFNGSGVDKAVKKFKQLEGAGPKAAHAVRAAAIPAGIALAGLAVAAVGMAKAAMADDLAATKLAGTLKRVTKATDESIASVESFITKLSMEVGVADDDLRPALGKLATATGNLTTAQSALGIALDISAQTGKPLATVTQALAKAYGGSAAGLAKLLPGLDKQLLKTGDMTAITKELATLTGGAAAEAANTAAGKFKVLTITFDETKEAIGKALLPAFEKIFEIIKPFMAFLEQNTKLVTVLGVAFAGVAASILLVNAAMKIVATIGLLSNPIGIVIAAVALLAAGTVYLYNKNKEFRDFVNESWPAIKAAIGAVVEYMRGPVMAVFDMVKGALNLIKGIVNGDFSQAWEGLRTLLGGIFDYFVQTMIRLPLIILQGALKIGQNIVEGIHDGLVGIGERVWSGIKHVPGFLADKLGDMAGVFRNMGADIVHFIAAGITGAASGIANGMKYVINIAINALNKAIDTINGISGVVNNIWPGPDIPNIGQIPKLAAGGIVTSPTIALIGERGPEAVIPLSGRNAGGMGMTITVNAGLVSTPDQIGQQIIEAIQRAQRTNGPAFLSA